MKRIAKFYKVSKERFTADWTDTLGQSQKEKRRRYMKQSVCQREQQQAVQDMISLHLQNLF